MSDVFSSSSYAVSYTHLIDVNHEFEVLYEFMEKLPGALKPGGRAEIGRAHV